MNNPRRIQRHLVKALAAGALLAAAALPLAIATAAGAAGVPVVTSVAFTPHGATANSFGGGASGTLTITGTGFADDGGTTTLALATGTHVSFTNVTETSSTTVTASFASTTAATSGTITVSDDNGTSTTSAAYTVDTAPSITTIAPAAVYEGTTANTVTITGGGFQTGATVSFANNGNGTPLTATVTTVSATSIVLSVTPTNPISSGAASTGAFTATITNPDGGSVSGGTLSVLNGIQEVSPSAVAIAAGASSDVLTITGAGFEYGATVAFGNGVFGTDTVTGAPTSCGSEIAITGTTVNSANSVTVNITETGATTALCPVTVYNNGAGLNEDAYTSAAGAFGLGEASTVAPLVTGATAPTAPVAVGSTTPVTLTGAGFSTYSVVASSSATFGATTASTGTTITASATVASGATAGAVAVTVRNTSAASAPFSPAFTISGPAITSAAPTSIAEGAPYGTTIVLTGTGFTNTTTGAVSAGSATGLAGIVSYVSPTTMDVVVTGKPTASGAGSVQLSQTTSTGAVLSPAFTLTVNPDPFVSSAVTFPTGAPSDVGVGATATTVYINGSNFETGATVTKFVNAAGVADPNVTATVTKVTSTQITATIAITAPDTNAAVGYTVSNPDGGTDPVSAIAYPIFIGAGPTITGVTPTTGTAGTTTSFAIAGTGFQSGAVVTLSPANGTCGATTFTASTTLAVTCTLGQPSSVATDLVVTNPDGGTATSAAVLAAAKPPTAPAFHVSGVHGAAVAGKWVTVTISGTGFYGQPKITSTAAGSKFAVSKDNGRSLTVKVWTKAGTKAGEHTLTVRLANGKSGKAGYNIKA